MIVIMNNITEEDEIDNSWVDNYKTSEENYNDFYNEKVCTIKVFFMYINSEKTIVNIKKDILSLTEESVLKREHLIALIKSKELLNNIRYKLFSLVRYNIDLHPTEINDFAKNPSVNSKYDKRFLIQEKYINDIHFVDTISIFQDLNCLYIIFKENDNNNNRKTKKCKKFKKFCRFTRHKHK